MGHSKTAGNPISISAKAQSLVTSSVTPAPQPVGVGSSKGNQASKGDEEIFEEFYNINAQ